MNRTPVTLTLLAVVAFPWISSAQETLKQTVDWSDFKDRGELRSGEVLPAEGNEPVRLRIHKTTEAEETIPLIELEPPKLNGKTYLMKGRVKYADLPQLTPPKAGYLELWNHFPDGGAYFTRTLGDVGPMAKFAGTSDWREVWLPFQKEDRPGPSKLVLNLSLPGPGTLELSNLELWDEVSLGAVRTAGAWWTDRTGGLIGGLAGSLLGLLGGAIGVAVGVFRQRTLGNVLSAAILVAGVACLAVGLIALTQAQPYAVYYPLLLLGGLCTLCAGIGLVVIRVGFQQDEFRRMQALDVR